MRMFFILLFSLFSSTVTASIIPASELFKSPDNFSFQLNPIGSHVAYRSHSKESEDLVLIDAETMNSFVVSTLHYKDGFRIKRYLWTDNSTIYIELIRSGTPLQKAFIHLNWIDKKLKATYNPITTGGYLVDPLLAVEGKVLFVKSAVYSHEIDRLYLATYKKLEKNTLDRQDRHPHNFNRASRYFSGGNDGSLFANMINDGVVEFWRFDEKLKEWTHYLTQEDKGYHFEPVGFLDSNTLAVLSNKDVDMISLYKYDVSKQLFGELLYQHPKYDLVSAGVDSSNGSVDFVRFYDHGRLTTEYFGEEEKQFDKAITKAFFGKQVLVVSKAFNVNKFIVNVFSSDDSGTYYLVDATTLKAAELLPRFNSHKNYTFNRSNVYTIKATNENEIEIILTRPQKNNNGVLLVMPHGGPVNVRDYDGFDKQTQYYVSRGFSTLKVNFRGSKGFGKDFLNQGVGEFGKKIEQDINAAIKFVDSKYPYSKHCAIGSSYGGYSSLVLGINQPEKFNCVVASFGVYDLPLIFNQTNKNLKEKKRESLERTIGKMRDELWDYSPFYQLEKLSVPLLLIAGKKDSVAHFEQSHRMKYRLQQLGIDFEHIFYERAAHGHPTWFGDRHEIASSYNFIMRKLKLPKLIADNLNEVEIEEKLMIAEGYDDIDFLQRKPSLSLKYNRLASSLGSAKAQYNIGAYYHIGEKVNYDILKASEWYAKASEGGSAAASYQMGRLYMAELLGSNQTKKALEMFQLAEKQGDELAYLELAKMQCLGIEIPRNFDACLNTLKLDDSKNDLLRKLYWPQRKRRNQIVEELLFGNVVSQEQKQKLVSLLDEVYGIDTIQLSAYVSREGLYDESAYFPFYVEHTETTNIVPIRKGARFGASIIFESDEELSRKQNDTVVRVRWITPELRDVNGKLIEQIPYLSFIELNSRYRYTYILEPGELVEGDWTLEISSLEGKVIYQKTFTTVQPEMKR